MKQMNQVPLAEMLRPLRWEDFKGLAAFDQNLLKRIQSGQGKVPSLILWGPPGSGKTTFARLVGKSFNCEFVELSAVLAGVKDIREVVEQSKQREKPTILFVDEIHRFNKGQQDAFLPHVEAGTFALLGATTENPSFYLTSALLSRCKVVVLPSLSDESLAGIVARAVIESGFTLKEDALKLLIEVAGGDARRLLNVLEGYFEIVKGDPDTYSREISAARIEAYLKDSKVLFYDRSGEEHYNMVSAFIKSMRGSDSDAALYWAFRMMESGEDPRFIIRRMMIFASEDIGNADPRALQLAVSTLQAYETLGIPEGKIPIAHCITYLASAPKSNRSYKAMHEAIAAVKQHPKVAVPLHLRNAPTGLMKKLGYGEDYDYPHDRAEGFTPGVQYLPDELKGKEFYRPSERGYEKTINERMQWLKSLKR